jgi:hypothetical protein
MEVVNIRLIKYLVKKRKKMWECDLRWGGE